MAFDDWSAQHGRELLLPQRSAIAYWLQFFPFCGIASSVHINELSLRIDLRGLVI